MMYMIYSEDYDDTEENLSSDSPPSAEIKPGIGRTPSIAFDRPHASAKDTYLQFVNTLLKECKTKVHDTAVTYIRVQFK